jgi:DNA invertase Pin-like site-specific DNA recombinase
MTETHPQNRRLGYARVSTYGQTLDAQLDQLRAAGCTTKIYREKVTGAHNDRRELLKMLKHLAPGDVVTVTRIDRLARSTFDLFGIVKRIVDAKAQFRSLAEPWADTDTSTGRLMLAVLGGLADVERDLIRTRTAEGRSRAKAQGKHMGRPTGAAERGHQTARAGCYVAGIGGKLRPQHIHDAPQHPGAGKMKSRHTKKRTLRTIDKDDIISVEEWAEIFKEINGVSDRSATILVAAHVDVALSSFIEAALLLSPEEEALKPLYERDGALSTFFSKIHLGYAMSLYDDKTRDDLEVIRKVRNAFSHVRRSINFNTSEIVKECEKLQTMSDHTHEVYKTFDWRKVGYQEFETLDCRHQFILTGLSINLHFMVYSVAKRHKTLEVLKAIMANFKAQRDSALHQ